MSDPRLQSRHLVPVRRADYRSARDRLLAARGAVTVAAEWADRLAPRLAARPLSRYALLQPTGGVCLPLRVGLTAVGRYPENDIVVERPEVSRRHCVFVAHAGGGCEVYDTASYNGTRVNGRRVEHAWLNPGDLLQLAGTRFVLVCDGDDGGPPAEPHPLPPDPDGPATARWDI